MPYIAFYKGKKKLWDKFVCFVTQSDYSHVELYHNGYFYSSSARDKGVRKQRMSINIDKWDLIELPYNENYMSLEDIYLITKNAKYDYISIFFNWLGINKDLNSKSFFCTEYVALLLNYLYKTNINGNVMPGKLRETIIRMF